MFKIQSIKRTAASLAVAFCLVAGTIAPAATLNRVRAEIQNNSSYDIYEIFMSSTGDDSWGRDLLRDGVLLTGRSFTITADPGRYDLKLVDEDGDSCVVMNLSLYANASWSITDRWLLNCEFHR